MHPTNRLARRTASSRGGFTLVELLVVIGIIAILAGVALGPITNGIKKAKQSTGVQSAHALGLAEYSAANDNNQLYPDASGGTAANVAMTLLGGGYVTDPTIFFLSGDTAAGTGKFSATTAPATTIAQSNISWDFLGNGGAGASSTSYPQLPLLWSTLGTTPPTIGGAAVSTAITTAPTATCPFGTDGVAIFYVNNSAAFLTSNTSSGTYQVTMVTASSMTSAAPGSYNVLQGK
jgi:prepilin-type N-terminal cleavage/methylation domain-containing protein